MKRAIVLLTIFFIAAMCYAQQVVVAVAPFDVKSGGISAEDADAITEVFGIQLAATGSVRVVTRASLEQVVQEHRFQASDWSSDEKTAALGKALNADWVVRGQVQKLGSRILVTVAMLDVRTHEIMGGASTRMNSVDDAYDEIEPLVTGIIRTMRERSSDGQTRIEFTGDSLSSSEQQILKQALLESLSNYRVSLADKATFVINWSARNEYNRLLNSELLLCEISISFFKGGVFIARSRTENITESRRDLAIKYAVDFIKNENQFYNKIKE